MYSRFCPSHALSAFAPTQFHPSWSATGSSTPMKGSGEKLTCNILSMLMESTKKEETKQPEDADAMFEKHVYGRATSGRKHQRQEDFDVRPLKHRGNANTQLTAILCNVRGKGLGTSLLKDESIRYWSTEPTFSTTHGLPNEH